MNAQQDLKDVDGDSSTEVVDESGESDELSPEFKDWLWDRRCYNVYRAELSTVYHRKRERFFALLDRCSKTLSLVAGTAAFSTYLASPEAKSFAGLVVAFATLPGLAFGWSDKARLHADLAQKFLAIQAEIASAGMTEFTEEDLDVRLHRFLTLSLYAILTRP